MTNFNVLLKTRFKVLKYKKTKITIFSVCLGLILLMNIVFAFMAIGGENPNPDALIDNIQNAGTYAVIFEMINSFLILIYVSVTVSLIFRDELDNNLVSLEERQGYKERESFGARLVEYVSEAGIFMLAVVTFNAIIGAVTGRLGSSIENDPYYSYFLSSLGWYAILLVMTSAIGIFFNSFSNVAVSVIISFVVGIIITIVGMMGLLIYKGTLQTKDYGLNVKLYYDAKHTAIATIYNPLLQWGFMFDGVNYHHTSYVTDLILGPNINWDGGKNQTQTPSIVDAEGNRIVFPEIVYLVYFLFNSLLIFISYWIWKVKVKA